MSQENLAAEIERLRIQLQAFAAIGAALHLRHEGASGDPRLIALVNEVTEALFLHEVGLPYETVPVDTSKGEQHTPAFRAINPNGKVPAIVDTEGPGGKQARVFDSSAILLYLGDKTGRFIGTQEDRPEMLSWLFFIASGLGPSPARRCISSSSRRKGWTTRATATAGRPSGITRCWTTIWPGATSLSATAIPSPTCPPGAGSTGRRVS